MVKIKDNKQIKILFLIPSLDLDGGAEVQFYNLISGLSEKKDILIKIVALKSGSGFDKFKSLNGVEIEVFSDKLSYFSFGSYISKLIKVYKSFKPEIIHSFLFHTNILAKFSLYFYKKNFSLICSYRGILSEYKLLNFLEKFNRKKVDLLIANSSVAANALTNYTNKENNNLEIINNGVFIRAPDEKKVAELKKLYSGKKIVITVGNIRFEKDYETNMLAAKEVIKKEKNVLFLYVGRGWEIDKMKARAVELKISENVEYLGGRDDVAELLTIADVFFLPTLFESQPNSVLEAMSYKKPIVSTDIAAFEILKPFNAKLSKPKDYSNMAKNILSYLKKAPSKKELEENYKIVQEKFSFESMIKKYYKIYPKLKKF